MSQEFRVDAPLGSDHGDDVSFLSKDRGNHVRSAPRKKKPARRPVDRAPGETAARPDVDINTKKQTIRVRDARIINAGQRAFCRRLLKAAARRPGISKAEVDLADACCQIEFAGQIASSQKMADLFASCVEEAAGGFAEAPTRLFGRKPDEWLKMTAYPLVNDVSLWETMAAKSNGVKLRHHCTNDEREMPRMAEAISRLEDVHRCQASLHSRSLTVDFRHSINELNGFMDQAERSFEQLLADEAKRQEVDLHPGTQGPIADFEVATGPQRLLYLALAGGMFLLTLVGLIVPGIPTVPFLLATSYFLARSSRWLDEKLRESIFFGSIVTEWERHRALGPQSKAKLMALSGAIVLFAIILSPLSPLVIITLVLVASLSAIGVYRLPGLQEEPRATVSRTAPRLALPAP
jgi:uncharacterized membrane protein YbaN (DUF454 family)